MRYLTLFLLLLPAVVSAQVQFSSTAGGTYVALDGKTVQGSMNVRLAGCPTGPWQFAIDGTAANTESTCPFALVGDDTLYDTKTLTNGAHTITAKGPTSTLTASFTVGNPGSTAWRGTATLNWKPPITNTDGTPLTNLIGYNIYHGTQANSLENFLTVSNAGLTEYVVRNMPAGTHYFAMTSINDSGGESNEAPALPITLTEPVTPPPTCPAQPAPETRAQACVAPTIGSWSQTHGWTSVAAPACWEAAPWTPASAPAGVCATPAPLVAGATNLYAYRSTTLPMALVGVVRLGMPCGPETKTVNGTKYCRVPLWRPDGAAQIAMFGVPPDLTLTDYWVKAAP
jgi:hypothetical protein